MKHFLVTLFFTGFVILLTSVDCKRITCQRYVFIKNDSNIPIAYYFDGNLSDKHINYILESNRQLLFRMEPHSVDSLHTHKATSGWDYIENAVLLVFDGNMYDDYLGESYELKNIPMLATYNLTLEDMQKLNWTITYPPTEEMKGMNIYLPDEDPLTKKQNTL